MKFACDECSAQYMIADEKVGKKGVKVRCKKCSHVIIVRPPVDTDPGIDLEAARGAGMTDPGTPPPEDPTGTLSEESAAASDLEATAGEDESVDATIVMPNPLGAPASPDSESGLAPVQAAAGSPVPVAATSAPVETGTGLEGGLGVELEAELSGAPEATPGNGASAAASEAPVAGAGLPEDEIGMAFDSIFGGAGPEPEAQSASPGDPFSSDVDDAFEAALGSEAAAPAQDEHASTRVFDASSMQLLASEREIQEESAWGSPSEETSAGGNGTAPEVSGEAEWYVAVEEERVGPLTVAEVQVRWEAGDLGPDSLCWRNGMPDWEPLSMVEGLKALIAPVSDTFGSDPAASSPTRDETEASEADLPEADGGWKPGAASLLASLAADEMDALENEPVEVLAAPTADPVGLPPTAQPSAVQPEVPLGSVGGLDLGSLPPPAASADDPEFSPPVVAGALPTPAGAFQPAPATRPPALYGPGGPVTGAVPALGPTTGQIPAMSPHTTGAMHTLPVGPATGQVQTMPPGLGGTPLTMGRLAALGGGLIGLLSLIIFVGLWAGGVFDKEVAVAATTPTPPAATPSLPVAGAAPAAAAAPVAGTTAPAVALATGTAPGSKPALPTAAAGTSSPPAAAKGTTTVARADRPKPSTRRAPRGGRKTTRASARKSEPKKPAPPKAATRTPKRRDDDLLGSDDFDDIFDDKPKRPKASSGRSSPSRGYVPPAPGAAKNLPKSLGQSDINGTVARHVSELKACAKKQHGAEPGKKGRFVMRWRIRPDGRPAGVSCKSAGAPVFCRCMKSAIGKMRFPRYGGPPMAAINFPFGY